MGEFDFNKIIEVNAAKKLAESFFCQLTPQSPISEDNFNIFCLDIYQTVRSETSGIVGIDFAIKSKIAGFLAKVISAMEYHETSAPARKAESTSAFLYELFPQSTRTVTSLANCMDKNLKTEAAIKLISDHIIKNQDSQPSLIKTLAILNRNLGKYDEAINHFRNYQEQVTHNSANIVYYDIGVCYLLKGDSSKARHSFETCLSKLPVPHDFCNLGLAVCDCIEQKFSIAIDRAKQTYDSNSGLKSSQELAAFKESCNIISSACIKIGEYDSARDFSKDSLRAAPSGNSFSAFLCILATKLCGETIEVAKSSVFDDYNDLPKLKSLKVLLKTLTDQTTGQQLDISGNFSPVAMICRKVNDRLTSSEFN